LTQVIFDSLIRASELTLLAVGLTMVYGVLRFPNFSHVEFAPLGAFLALYGTSMLGLPLVVAVVPALIIAGFIGVGCDRAVFSRLRDRSPIMLMIAAFALGIVIRELLRAYWGPSPYFYDIGLQRPMNLLGANVTQVQIGIILTAALCMLGFHFLLKGTKLGVAMRATADNPDLAEASGIDTERVIRQVWFIGSSFAALGGILLGLDTQIQPNMGFGIIIPVFCAAILGGIGHPHGAMFGALVLGFAENIGLAIDWQPVLALIGIETGPYAFIPTGYKAAIPFTLLILVLLVRPQGLVGSRAR